MGVGGPGGRWPSALSWGLDLSLPPHLICSPATQPSKVPPLRPSREVMPGMSDP